MCRDALIDYNYIDKIDAYICRHVYIFFFFRIRLHFLRPFRKIHSFPWKKLKCTEVRTGSGEKKGGKRSEREARDPKIGPHTVAHQGNGRFPKSRRNPRTDRMQLQNGNASGAARHSMARCAYETPLLVSGISQNTTINKQTHRSPRDKEGA